ncbi:PARP-domain-containing protein [Rhizodiscina lignyota]|uniref:Poly [ADP-ribose] polymerase n=1 Tax=Rhizodiscina lignyota TaxID=1504668 RepID=A0A9P4IH99_9PEZI|nr:PARP-domain-containing protein [Rhizodiscina lignyota]
MARGTKRKQAPTAQSSSAAPAKQAKQDGQKAVSKDLNIPIDEGFNQFSTGETKVYVDEDGLIYDVSLNQTNIGNNANKFYRLQLLDQDDGERYFCHTRWGRVGEFGQRKIIGPSDFNTALKEFNKKFKDKSGNKWEDRGEPPVKGKYTFIEKNYEDDEDDGQKGVKKEEEDDGEEKKATPSTLPMATQRLMELIFNQNHFNSVLESIGYNQDKLPLGKLGKSTLKKGFEHLKEIASLLKHPSLAQNKYSVTQNEALEDLSNQYYSTIPHIFGRNRAPVINNDDLLRKEVAMLDDLTDMEVANAIMKSTDEKKKDAASVSLIDKRFAELGMNEMTPLDKKSNEYKELQSYLISSTGKTHYVKYRLEEIFRIERNGEYDRFEKSKYAKIGDKNRRLLWHGSRTTNFGGILSQGLRIAPPEAPVNGYAFGKGVYMADMSSKSANYCMSGMSGGTALLLLCEAELGNPMYEIPSGNSMAEEECKKKKCIATLGVGRTVPLGWKDAECLNDNLKGVSIPDSKAETGDNKNTNLGYLQYNEYIVYDVSQIRLRYLLRVKMD